jgi:hypothetical protein
MGRTARSRDEVIAESRQDKTLLDHQLVIAPTNIEHNFQKKNGEIERTRPLRW